MNHVIIITGASSGIGAALAAEVARRGAKGIVLAARREAELAKLADQLGPTALAVPADVTRRADLERVRDRALDKFGQLDVIVNNAGRGITRQVSELTDADLDDMFATNVKSVVYGIQAVLPHFKQQRKGQIVTISSGLSRLPFASARSAYSAAKAAVNLLMASLRVELRAQYPDIFATTVIPGVVATEFGSNALHGGPDSRGLPNAQPVGEVAQRIADAIERPLAECYTRPEIRDLVARYFTADDVGAIEAGPPFFTGMPR